MNYVVGFLFDPQSQWVALIKKVNPAWQRGKLNGLGGKIEDGETPYEAMVREFAEESGVEHFGWEQFATMRYSDGMKYTIGNVYFFRAWGSLDHLKTMTEELVCTVPVVGINKLPVIPNLKWMIPLALDSTTQNCEVWT